MDAAFGSDPGGEHSVSQILGKSKGRREAATGIGVVVALAITAAILASGGSASAQVAPTPTVEERLSALADRLDAQLDRGDAQIAMHDDDYVFLLGAIGNAMTPFTHSLSDMDRIANTLDGNSVSLSLSSQAVTQAAQGLTLSQHCQWLKQMLDDTVARDVGIGLWTASILMEQPTSDGQSCAVLAGGN